MYADYHTRYLSQLRLRTKLPLATRALRARRLSQLLPITTKNNEKTFTSDKTPVRTRNYESITTRHPYFFAGDNGYPRAEKIQTVYAETESITTKHPYFFACDRKYPRAKKFFFGQRKADTTGRGHVRWVRGHVPRISREKKRFGTHPQTPRPLSEKSRVHIHTSYRVFPVWLTHQTPITSTSSSTCGSSSSGCNSISSSSSKE
jgi:hypothetical protein